MIADWTSTPSEVTASPTLGEMLLVVGIVALATFYITLLFTRPPE